MKSSKEQKHLLDFKELKSDSTTLAWWRRGADGCDPWCLSLTSFQSRDWTAPEATFRMYFLMVDEEVKGTRWVFPEVGRVLSIYNWMCFLVADLWFIFLNQCQLRFFFVIVVVVFVFLFYGAIHLGGQSNDLLFALDSVSINSHLVYLWT